MLPVLVLPLTSPWCRFDSSAVFGQLLAFHVAADRAERTSKSKWTGLLRRVEDRLITGLDLTSIVVFDAVILAVGYLIVSETKRLSAAELPQDVARFFEIARWLSGGLFLLLYTVVVATHVYRFLRTELHS